MFTTEHSPQRIRRIALGDMLQRSACRFGEHTALIDGEQRIRTASLTKKRTASRITYSGKACARKTAWECYAPTRFKW